MAYTQGIQAKANGKRPSFPTGRVFLKETSNVLKDTAKVVRPRGATLAKISAGVAGTLGVLSLGIDGVIPGLGSGLSAIFSGIGSSALSYGAVAAGGAAIAGVATSAGHRTCNRLKVESKLSDKQMKELENYILCNEDKISVKKLATFAKERFGIQYGEQELMNLILAGMQDTQKSDIPDSRSKSIVDIQASAA